MVFLDMVLACFMAYGIFKGVRNGLFVELASLVSFIIGIYVAVKCSYLLQNSIGSHLPGSPKTIQITAFVLTFILVVVGIRILAKVFTTIADFAFLGWINRIGGAVLGLVRMMIFLGIFLGLLLKVEAISLPMQQKSLLLKPVLKMSELVLPVLKHWFEDLKSKTT